MVAGVVDRALAGLDQTLAEEADLVWAGGFRYASYLDEARPLGLMLEEDSYRVLAAEVVLGSGGRERPGDPGAAGDRARGERPEGLTGLAVMTAPQFTAALAAQVEQAECRLDAVIGRLAMPIGQIMDLAVGDVLDLPQAGAGRHHTGDEGWPPDRAGPAGPEPGHAGAEDLAGGKPGPKRAASGPVPPVQRPPISRGAARGQLPARARARCRSHSPLVSRELRAAS